MFWIIASLALIVLIIYELAIRPYKYWTNRGVKQGNPVPIFGDSFGSMTKKESFAEFTQKIYNISKNSRYAGCYQFLSPFLVLRDPALIKQITVKDFDHFMDHHALIPEGIDPLWSENLFNLNGANWRKIRSTISPAFTSSKMKFMFELMRQNAEKFAQYFIELESSTISLEMKDTLTRFANDVIALIVFGIECNSLKEPNNDFYLMAKATNDFTGFSRTLKIFGYMLAPKLWSVFKFKFFPQEPARFFTSIIEKSIENRTRNGIVRADMMHLLLQARKGELEHDKSDNLNENIRKLTIITDDVIKAQTFGFLFAGFESVSNLMCFMAYELALNPDIQARLIIEIDETLDAFNGEVTYEAILSMKYLDMVVSESLRKWPSTVLTDRICTKSYTIQPETSQEKPLYIEPGTVLRIPIFAIQRDPEYYPDPDRFDPERFSDENKSKINPYTYLVFGTGPRNCMGARFAMLEVKTLFFYLLRYFEITPNEKTQIPIKIAKSSFSMTSENGFWLDLKRRAKNNYK